MTNISSNFNLIRTFLKKIVIETKKSVNPNFHKIFHLTIK